MLRRAIFLVFGEVEVAQEVSVGACGNARYRPELGREGLYVLVRLEVDVDDKEGMMAAGGVAWSKLDGLDAPFGVGPGGLAGDLVGVVLEDALGENEQCAPLT